MNYCIVAWCLFSSDIMGRQA